MGASSVTGTGHGSAEGPIRNITGIEKIVDPTGFRSVYEPGVTGIQQRDPGFVNLTVRDKFITTPSTITNVTATEGITVTNPLMRLEGSGGIVTADPPIAAGTDGQIVTLMGTSDTNTVSLSNGDSLHMHEATTLRAQETITLLYEESGSHWVELSRSSPTGNLDGGDFT